MRGLKPTVLGFLVFSIWPWQAQAIDARLLPEGVLRVRLYESWYQGDQMYDPAGHRQPLGQTGLDKLAGKGVPVAVANAYAIRNTAQYALQRTDLSIDYGLSRNIDLGAWIPFLDPSLEQSTTLTRAGGWGALPTAQQAVIAGAVAQLNGSDGEHRGLGDVFVGVKGRILGEQKARERFSLGGGVRLPTGHVANPLDPRDFSTGDGQWDLSLWSWFDFQPGETFFVNLHTRHDYGLSGSRDTQFPTDATRVGRMDFQPGLHHYVQLEPQWRVPLERVELQPSLFFIYDRQERGKQQGFYPAQSAFVGPMLPAEGTDWQRLMFKPSLGVSFVPMGVPMALYLGVGKALWGKNTPEVSVVELRMDFFFETSSRPQGTSP
ncbi:MAG: hypothetical protein HQL64_12345 [Magnetococcales bacterium]|nr:hypothetical protein [Magnetococcales bacterium]